MHSQPIKPSKKLFPVLPVLAGLAVLGVLIAAAGFGFAATQESHDSFCASCHTQPESSFFLRATTSQPVDLASFHTPKNTGCIDCHSGEGILGRMQAEILGAHNALAWYTGTAVQPARLTFPISDANCLKCHQQVTQTAAGGPGGGRREGEGRRDHWHSFLARWQAADPNAGTCVSCHSGHSTDVNAQNGFQNEAATQVVCDACHRVLRKGEGN